MRLQTSLLLVVLLATTVADKVGSAEPVDMSCKRTNTAFPGADLSDFETTGFEACANFCRDTYNCKAITFHTSGKDKNGCYLKHRQGGENGPIPINYADSMNMNCDNEPVDMSCKRIGSDFWGADLRDFITTGFEACANFCRDAYNCKAITFNTNKNRCYLKYRQGGEKGPIPINYADSMNMNCDNTPVDMSCRRIGIDFVGADLRDFITTGFEACANFCRDAYNCEAITFVTQDESKLNYKNNKGRCYLKYRHGGEKGPLFIDIKDSMNLDCDNKPVDMSCKRYNTEFWGADLRNVYACFRIEYCANLCRDTYNCKAFTYNDNANKCFLKYRQGGEKGPNPEPDLISMNMDCDNEPVDMSCQSDNTDFWGADLRDFTTTGVEACANFCRDAYNCKAITFHTSGKYNNRCYLKDKQGGENPKPDHRSISINVPC